MRGRLQVSSCSFTLLRLRPTHRIKRATDRTAGGVPESPAGSYQPGVAQVLDENLVDEIVLRKRLDHHHPLCAQLVQDVGDVQRLQETKTLRCVERQRGGRTNAVQV